MEPFRIFVSSPVDGIEKYRSAVMDAAHAAQSTRLFEFFFYEHYENNVISGKTVSESIIENSGSDFDALLVFFKDRLGPGTIEEIEFFEKVVIPRNTKCEVWWSKIYCPKCDLNVKELEKRLTQKYNTSLPTLSGKGLNNKPEILTFRLTAKLNQVAYEIGRRAQPA